MSTVETGPRGTFVGVYDGHGGPEASQFINNHLFENIKTIRDAECTSENQEMSADVIKNAYLATEEEFLSMVKRQWKIRPQIASVGSYCLVGVICSGQIYITDAGDSRAVLARVEKADKQVKAIQLSSEHNASLESVREELRSLHPEDPRIVVLKHTVWRVKGIQENLQLLEPHQQLEQSCHLLLQHLLINNQQSWLSLQHTPLDKLDQNV